jgi:hypothetical protein
MMYGFTRSFLALSVTLILPVTAPAWDAGCRFKADRAAGVEAAGVQKVVIRAGAGEMKVIGRGSAVRIEGRGVACASTQELLDATRLHVRREGNTVVVETAMAHGEHDGHSYLDLGIALPSGLPVEATDSSGDAVFEDLAALTLQDSSGDLDVRRVSGLVDVGDSSGDIDVVSVGSVRLRDSSGDIEVQEVRGDVEVELDSSGDIRILSADGGVRVRQDSSGSIRVEDVQGSVQVDSDSSGDIHASRVRGDFTVSEDSSGTIGHEAIGGRVRVPNNARDGQ